MNAKNFFIVVLLALGSWACEDDPTCQELENCELGTSCTIDSECAEKLCLQTHSADTPICTKACETNADCAEATCAVLTREPESGPESFAACSDPELGFRDLGDPCTSELECVGAICYLGRCSSLCAAKDHCPPDAKCEFKSLRLGPEHGFCVWRPLAPDWTAGPFAVSPAGSEPISVTVPERAISMTITIRNSDDTEFGRRVGFRKVIAPDSTVIFDVDAGEAINPAAIRYPQATVFMAPVSDSPLARPQAGVYTVTLGVWNVDPTAEIPFAPTEGEIDAVEVVFGTPEQTGGVLDLVLHASPNSDVELTPDSEFVATLLAKIESHFASAPLVIGSVEFADLAEEHDTMSTSNDIRNLCEERAVGGIDGTAVNMFFVQDLTFASGFTGTAPSPPGLFGYGTSGLVVEHKGDIEDTARFAVHELGHFLGLSHTTRFTGSGGDYSVVGPDPISDTPVCTTGNIDACEDADNLMFQFLEMDDELMLTRGQLSVVGGHASLFELRRPDLCSLTDQVVDITRTRAYAGAIIGASATSGSCSGTGGERAHVLRVFEQEAVTIEAEGINGSIYIRHQGCDATELACAVTADGRAVLNQTLEPGVYFVFVDAAPGNYQLRVRKTQP